MRRGFGAVKVSVSVGQTKWRSSVFPDAKSGRYLLPLKAEVRKKVKIAAGDTIGGAVEVVDLDA